MKFKEVDAVINDYARDVVKQAQKNLNTPGFDGQPKGRKKSNTGALADSLGYKIDVKGDKIVVVFTSTKDYASIVEEGRDKGAKMPPSGVIDKWVVQRNIKGARDEKGRFVSRKRMVYAIRRKISTQGIKPVRYFSEAMNEIFEMLPERLKVALVTDLEDIIFDAFQKSKFEVRKV